MEAHENRPEPGMRRPFGWISLEPAIKHNANPIACSSELRNARNLVISVYFQFGNNIEAREQPPAGNNLNVIPQIFRRDFERCKTHRVVYAVANSRWANGCSRGSIRLQKVLQNAVVVIPFTVQAMSQFEDGS